MKNVVLKFGVLSLVSGLLAAATTAAWALPVNRGVTTAFIDTHTGILKVKCAGCTNYVDVEMARGYRIIDFNMEGDTVVYRAVPGNTYVGQNTLGDLYVVTDTRTGRAAPVAGGVDNYAVDSNRAAIGYQGMTYVIPRLLQDPTTMTLQLKERPVRLALNEALAFTRRGPFGNELYAATNFKSDMQTVQVAVGVDDLFRVNGSVLAFTQTAAQGKALYALDLRYLGLPQQQNDNVALSSSVNMYQVEKLGDLPLVVYADTSGQLEAAWPMPDEKGRWAQRVLVDGGVRDFRSDGGVIVSRSRFNELFLHPLDGSTKPEVLGSGVADYKLLGDRVAYIDNKGSAVVVTGLSQRETVRFHKLDTGFGTPVQQIALGADGTVVVLSGGTLFVAKDLYDIGGDMVPLPTTGRIDQIEMRDGRIMGALNGKTFPLDCLLKLSKF